MFGNSLDRDFWGFRKFGGQSSLLANLTEFWKLDEASGNRVGSVGGNDLGPNGSPLPGNTTGKIGNAVNLNGSNQYLSILSNPSLQTGDIDFTLACWAYQGGSIADSGVANKWGSTAPEQEYLLEIYQNKWTWNVEAASGANTSIQWPTTNTIGAWTLAIVWHDSVNNQIGLQVDNGTPITAAWANGVRAGSGAFEVGRYQSVYFNGRIDALGLWKKVLTSAERTDLWNGGAGKEYPF